jgi:hypothetical protein
MGDHHMAGIPKPEDMVPKTNSLQARLYANQRDKFSSGDSGTGNGKKQVPPLALPMHPPRSKKKGGPGGRGSGNLVPRKPENVQMSSRRPFKRGAGPRSNGAQAKPLPALNGGSQVEGSQSARVPARVAAPEEEKPTRKTLLQKADTFKSFIESLEANVDEDDPGSVSKWTVVSFFFFSLSLSLSPSRPPPSFPSFSTQQNTELIYKTACLWGTIFCI